MTQGQRYTAVNRSKRMPREKLIRIGEDEKELLDDVRLELYGTDSVPYGEVIAHLCTQYLEDAE